MSNQSLSLGRVMKPLDWDITTEIINRGMIREGNQRIIRRVGYNNLLKSVNIQYKNDYVLGISFLCNHLASNYYKIDKEDRSELKISDFDSFCENIYMIPDVFEIPMT